MSYTTPRTWSTAEVVTAALLNTHVRDNLNFLAGPPRCSVYNSTTQSINNAASTALTFDTEHMDNDTMHSTSSNTNRITFTTAGVYLVEANPVFVANATGYREAILRLNGATVLATDRRMSVTAAANAYMLVSRIYTFAAADYVECMVQQTSGGALDIVGVAGSAFSAHLLSI